jgi:uncharacterized membrane protein (UPF0127 family)
MAVCRCFILMILTLSCMASISGCQNAPATPADSVQVTIDGRTFVLELALDTEARTIGLMNRDSIPEDGGMLFVFPDDQRRSFWMGNCLIDIDVIFLDHMGYITAMHAMKAAPPRSPDESAYEYRKRLPEYWSGPPARFAIELRGGWLEELDLYVDQRLDIDVDTLKPLAQ